MLEEIIDITKIVCVKAHNPNAPLRPIVSTVGALTNYPDSLLIYIHKLQINTYQLCHHFV